MKFIINRAVLIGALKQAKQIARGGSLPALSAVLVKAWAGGVSIAASNITSRLEQTIQADLKEAGDFLVSCDRLFDVLSQIKEESVSIAAKSEKEIEIAGGKIKAKLFCLSINEFPARREYNAWPVSFQTEADFCEILGKVFGAVNPNESREDLCGVHLVSEEGRLTVVGTDGRRLHMQETDIPVTGDLSAIAPVECVSAIRTVFAEKAIRISVSENAMEIRADETRFTFQLIEGNYPRFRQVVPEELKEKIALPRAEFLSAIESASALLARDKVKGVRITIGKGGVNVRAKSAEVGDIDIALPHPSKLERKFTAAGPYLAEALRNFTGAEVALENIDALSPITFREGQFTAVIMPIRTQD